MEFNAFQIAVNRWSESLSKQVAIYREAGRKVYIIALSRKMPRFFDWLEKEMHTPEVIRLFELINTDEVEITTEYALPLIHDINSVDESKPAGIIADDAIIFGATANKVATQWLALSGEVPYLTALFRSDRGIISQSLESDYSIGMSRMSFGTLSKNMKEISMKIMSSSLPVDMEYPIIHISKPYADVKAFINKSFPLEWRRYVVKSSLTENSDESFTILLEDCGKDGLSNDFAKIRLFKKPNGCCLEIISPASIRVDNLFDVDLFANTEKKDDIYNELWQYVYNKIFSNNEPSENNNEGNKTFLRKIANHACLSSLAIWAEYLISFSTFINFRHYLLLDVNDMQIDKHDIKLILGSESADYVVEQLNLINYTCHVNCGQTTEVAFDGYYTSSQDLRPTYLREITKSLNHGASLKANLDALFMVSHYSGDIFTKIPPHDFFSHHCFGESYDSLVSLLSGYNDDETDKLMLIHQWIDMRIDESSISPKFALVSGSDKWLYVRRFFLCGSNQF